MTLEFSDAQKHALTGFGKPYLTDPDVRNWPLKDRHDLFFSYDLITIFIAANTSSGTVFGEICVVSKYTLAAVSQTFAEHLLQNPNIDTFTFDVGRMNNFLRHEHEKALNTLNTWLINLSTPNITDLQAPTFYSEVSLRHIARQLGMSSYLTDRPDTFIHDAQTHILQPWQITELLYASSIEVNAPYPIVMEDDPLLGYLAQKLNETMNLLWAQEREQVHKWLEGEDNKALRTAMRRLREGKWKASRGQEKMVQLK
ncbi:uncharacterized protein N0V89_001356 [Didymosphaeria variabile]|uniref:Uncharacterized protein n=1 Tax=Didymosphaeria variabile TaxID=1932322 RepID=A0A9W8XW39_9PLEO|nr:uncharacterized protein N0V89_001356 [Didymosphaeria variabile]KAJ4360789.1 hypothetical protein N0V89_001356 [Didymosphaeria variabile]